MISVKQAATEFLASKRIDPTADAGHKMLRMFCRATGKVPGKV